ncbi:unnamed protein product [Sphagnum jensenii]|uniref:Uncharacterized protein n=1 Tax=Sphagnum jensenii TaxID=128206 RepID=A0ABP0XDH6_9BRYO
MADQLDDDGDEEWFKEVYGAEYTGLQRHHRTHDFTSREAKVWEAKAKAVERNWKRRKAEEGRGTYLPSLW